MATEGKPPRLALEGITKRFPGVLANDDVSFSVAPGEIHALLGENGAGKSTLVKIIYGVLQADEGRVLWDGEPVSIANPKAARRLGIGMVFQHFSLFEAMTVLENIALGLDHSFSWRELQQRVGDILKTYDLPLDPNREVHTLSVGERQRIEIVRSLLQSPKLLIMDEPTSVLTPQEVDRLFETLRRLAAEGCSILYISHKLNEIQALCDTATILRGGQVVATCDPREESARSMAEMMIGASLRDVSRKPGTDFGPERLRVTHLSAPGEGPFGVPLKDINLSVRAGEVVGIAGVAGNGQNELLAALVGEIEGAESGNIFLDGVPSIAAHVGDRRRDGMCSVPEERNGHGAVPACSLTDNAVLTARHRMELASHGFIRYGAAEKYAEQVISAFDVKATGPRAPAASLSGGNLQKFIMGREILQKPDVLIVSQPTWGVDAGAAAAIHQALVDLAAAGSAILLISQDLDELLALCDRIAVINGGVLSDMLDVEGISIERVGLLMGGMHGEDAAGNGGDRGEPRHDPLEEQVHAA
ncbi:ABC transporter ATP-binding protein [Afifella marina]|uniref:Nucleoside ABC transporter ATP-binding protein n=1 Tax=Afifella marina DSM 2698 TaxID=1120955 RepID=A0A1G5M6E9_AFIMA|nr:ABC transporter ATP-binding protein [Afifella marina]MBK1622909.1 ABC transporter ATP-binding protein [Afifella marina DSM 2698]MBK1625904.1 ABC transporter ATP-binding protein [Afifella marina]MBK5917726.1 ABC transporter [Afifella marina]RAI23644.1 ABC transporter [Afifella marina DSM 2698]SCZ20752.1 nucleoside ABC transporter ATP-binding protein [Afifella marina DSM 2698]